MITLQGTGVSPGMALGQLIIYNKNKTDILRVTVTDRDAEWERFLAAQAHAVEQLGILAQQVRVSSGDEAAALLEGHQLLAEDPDLTDEVEALIRGEGLCAEAAVTDAGAAMMKEFAELEDPYLRERSADFADVTSRIVACLTGSEDTALVLTKPAILAAEDLTPSETVRLDREMVLGLITSGGSVNGHTAIMARTMGIPATVGVEGILAPELEGQEIFVDGDTGRVIAGPDETTRETLLGEIDEQRRLAQQLKSLRGQPDVTIDGRTIRIYCNISGPQDIPAVLENDGEGIGLFRSEFLYLGREDYPDEDSQFEAYRQTLLAMGDREVIIRTMDIGADKRIGYFELPEEENPALGNRALRVSLMRPELFRTQLRALYRASAYGKLGIMFPMVTSIWEISKAREMCEQVKRELGEEGIPFSDQVQIGIMVETPAAAIISDLLAGFVDFFSCGTNDLTQYTLACDRQNSSLESFCDPHHPAVLRLIRLVTQNAHNRGVRVGICGELAADPELTETFLAMGIDELSVSPRMVLPLRKKIRETDVSACHCEIP